MLSESRFWILVFACWAFTGYVFGAPVVSSVLVSQSDEKKLVFINYDLGHSEGMSSTVTVEITLNEEYWLEVQQVTGDVGEGVIPGAGKLIVWDATVELGAQLFPAVKVRVRADDEQLREKPVIVPGGFSFLPADFFSMGSPEREFGRSADEGKHIVTLTRSFLIGQAEVPFVEWESVREWALKNGYTDLPLGRNGYIGGELGLHPVNTISWYGAIKWMNAKSERDGLSPCYSIGGEIYRTGISDPVCDFDADGYRLPTEAEWEYACRAGSLEAFYTGEIAFLDSVPVDPNLDAAGWYLGNSLFNTHPVGDPQKLENDFGLRDMHGNVAEWCWDWYGDYPERSVIDPIGPLSGSTRLKRGGGYTWFARHCRSAYRSHIPPRHAAISIGIRIVRTVMD